MIQVRRGVFETNSSSTHSLTIWDSLELTPEQEKRLHDCDYIIEPINSNHMTSEQDIEKDDLEGKLTYLWTLLLQADLPQYKFNNILGIIQDVVPNVKFVMIPRVSIYIYEDGNYGFSNWDDAPGDIQPWLDNPNLLKAFLINGEVHQWNRDWEDSGVKECKDSKALKRVKWSG